MAERQDSRRLRQVPIPSPRVQHAPTGSVDRFAQFTAGDIPATNTPAHVASDLKGAPQGVGERRQPNFTKFKQPRLNK